MFKILIPTDFSPAAYSAAKYALAISDHFNLIEITLFHCIDTTLTANGLIHELQDVLLKEAEKEIKKMSDELAVNLKSGVHIEYDVIFGNVEDEILRKTVEGESDLVVMGTKGAGGIEKVLFGSTASKVVEEVKNCPVIVVPFNTPIKPITSILYATDLADLKSESELIIAFGKLFHACIDILHVTDDPEKEKKQDEVKVAYELVKNFNYVALSFHAVFNLDPLDGIEDFIIKNKPSIVAMFTRRKTIFDKFLKGNLTKEMAFHTHVPLLAIPYDLILK